MVKEDAPWTLALEFLVRDSEYSETSPIVQFGPWTFWNWNCLNLGCQHSSLGLWQVLFILCLWPQSQLFQSVLCTADKCKGISPLLKIFMAFHSSRKSLFSHCPSTFFKSWPLSVCPAHVLTHLFQPQQCCPFQHISPQSLLQSLWDAWTLEEVPAPWTLAYFCLYHLCSYNFWLRFDSNVSPRSLLKSHTASSGEPCMTYVFCFFFHSLHRNWLLIIVFAIMRCLFPSQTDTKFWALWG